MKTWISRCIALLFFLGAAGAHGGVLTSPGQDLEVSLITYGPGTIYWERFGHDSIRIRDRVSGESGDFNYGVFDFEDSAFMWNFARGRMRYMIDVSTTGPDQKDYVDEGRSVLEQRLALTPAQAQKLRDFLLWNLRPENVSYDYYYLDSNCATRIRDALDKVLGGVLKAALMNRPAPLTYRQQIDRLMAPQPQMMLPMDLGMGPITDRPLNEWQESFLPMVLARELRSIRVPDDHGGLLPLVASERELFPNRLPAPRATAPNLAAPLGGIGLALALLMLSARNRFPRSVAWVMVGYVVLAGLLGTVLLALWALTAHYAAWRNENLLIFNPFAFGLIIAAWRARLGARGTAFAKNLVVLQLAAVLLALVLHFLPATAQQNLPWLLFALPLWLVTALRIWQLP